MKLNGDAVGRSILIIALALSVFGVVAVLSASVGTCAASREYGYNALYFFERQCLFLVLGVGAMLVTRKYVHKLRAFTGLPFVLVTIALLICVLFTTEVNGARRWINLGLFKIQVGEFAKLAMVMYWADYLARRRGEVTATAHIPRRSSETSFQYRVREFMSAGQAILPPALLSIVVVVLVEMGRDVGTIFLIGATILGLLYAVGASQRMLATGLVGAFSAVAILICRASYRIQRMLAYFNPAADRDDTGYQVVNSFIAIGSGGMFGCGMPYSGQKYDFLPEQHTDFIYAIICEELGFVGSLGVLLLFGVFCYCGFRLAVRCKDAYRGLLAFGITFQMAVQLLFNLGVVTGLLPNKGLPLPFISYGGSSLLVSFINVGILLNIYDNMSRYSSAVHKKAKTKRRVRSGATLSSSEQPVVKPISSGEWEAIVAPGRRDKHTKSKLPRPVVEPVLLKPIPFEWGTRAERERMRRMQGD